MVCCIDGCNNEARTRGYCTKHYVRLMRYGDPVSRRNVSREELGYKLSFYIISNNGCWEWQKGFNSKGYPTLYHFGKKRYAHRLSYSHHNNVDIDSLDVVMHTCDNPKCINPAHLVGGSQKDNIHDMIAKDRHLYGERRAMRFTEKDVLTILSMAKNGIKQKEIISKFNSTQSSISAITCRRTWRHINVDNSKPKMA